MNSISNFLKPRLFLTIFLIVGFFGSIISAIWMIGAILIAPNGTRAHDIALGFDRLGNSATGGNGQETISSRAGRLMSEKRGWACVLCKFLDMIQKDHCKKSIGV